MPRPATDTIRHHDTRRNIPTGEQRAFLEEDEAAPASLRYPRDDTLDPQLVWKGKDQQDGDGLAVSVVPIYIQEKIHPQALVEDLRRRTVQPERAQLDFFADFDGSEVDDAYAARVDFYAHDRQWTNRMVLGDSLLVMASLAEKEGLRGKVQTIYLDPPYGIKFGSNWQVSTRKRSVTDGKAEDASRQPEQVKAFRDTWELGIHSYLSYLRDRLVVARDLLTESGSVFVQIGDENVHLVRSVLDEVFGPESFCSQIAFRKTTGKGSALLDNTYDVLLWYAKDRQTVKYKTLYSLRNVSNDLNYSMVELPGGERRRLTREETRDSALLPAGSRVFRYNPLTSQSASATTLFSFDLDGKDFNPGAGGWKTNRRGMDQLAKANRLVGLGKTMTFVRYFVDFPYQAYSDIWDDTRQSGFGDAKTYVVQTGIRVVERCLLMTTDPGDLVLDPTCGSGTTAYVAEQWGRRWITVDTSRVALALARTRLMAARYPFYVLSDSPEGQAEEAKRFGQAALSSTTANDVRKGFVYERVPHVTLESIANNPDISEGMSRAEIDAAIARHAESETLFDQPYQDPKRVRVAGPFTVESLSPHRVLPADADLDGAVDESEAARGQDFATMILDNLRRAGVQSTRRDERLRFDTLEPYPGRWIQAEGAFTDADGQERRVAVTLGPEHGTVGPKQVHNAALEARRGYGFDILVVCGFAFDPHVSDESLQYPNLQIQLAKMNPDLAMGDELLKKTGAGNLFMVFGEPDIDVRATPDGQVEVELRGLDVYDPTTGAVRSNTTDDIACWFIDTAYDDESFFVRQAYFTGAGDPYEKLRKALRAEIDEAAWSTLYRTVSRPFESPPTGRIAVKVINHYGDEVLKVYDA